MLTPHAETSSEIKQFTFVLDTNLCFMSENNTIMLEIIFFLFVN